MLDNNILKQYYPGSEGFTFEPMLIHKSTDIQLKQACESGEWFGQIKKDGALYQYVKGFNGKSYLFGRTLSKVTNVLTEKGANVPHIMSALDSLPNGTVLIGEIYYQGGTSKNVISIMGCLPKRAVERQEREYGLIHYYIHDILAYDGINFVSAKTNNELRYKILEKVFYLHGLDAFEYLDLAWSWDDRLYERVGNALSAGEEGMVLKKKDGVYEPGKRPMSNLKAKKTDFADVVIMGFEMPTIEYYGKELETWQYWINPSDGGFNTYEDVILYPIGYYYEAYKDNGELIYMPVTKPFYMGWWNSRIKIGAYNSDGELVNIGTIHSGISDAMKQDMTEHPEKYLNQVCSIECMELDSEEKTIRHGFWKSMREDKNPKECTLSSIF